MHCFAMVDALFDALFCQLMHCPQPEGQCIKCMSVHVDCGLDALPSTSGKSAKSASSASNITKKQIVTEGSKTAAIGVKTPLTPANQTLCLFLGKLMHLMHLMHWRAFASDNANLSVAIQGTNGG